MPLIRLSELATLCTEKFEIEASLSVRKVFIHEVSELSSDTAKVVLPTESFQYASCVSFGFKGVRDMPCRQLYSSSERALTRENFSGEFSRTLSR